MVVKWSSAPSHAASTFPPTPKTTTPFHAWYPQQRTVSFSSLPSSPLSAPLPPLPPPPSSQMRVVCVSDTHGLHQELTQIPDGDVFIHAGDFTDTGDRQQVVAFNAFLATLPHKYKLVIAGNHETTFDHAFYPLNWHHFGHKQPFDPTEVRALLTNALYLEDLAVLIDGFLFYGTPWQPAFCNWAFNLPRGDAALVAQWHKIPSQVDLLITHSPPMGHGDQVGESRVGCADLLNEIQSRIQPTCHVFGHVHEGYGVTSDGVTTFVNASACTHEYEATNPPIVVELTQPRVVHDMANEKTLRYEVLLHEQLRVCSQKPVFVPLEVVEGGEDYKCDSTSKSLADFRVEGTPSALLLESTLKLRPVRAETQTRALRYLFRHGFQTKQDGEEEEREKREEGTHTRLDRMDGDDDQDTSCGASRSACVVHPMATNVIEELGETARADMALVVPIVPIVPLAPLPRPPTPERRDSQVLRCQESTLVEEQDETRQPVAVAQIPPAQPSAQQETLVAAVASSCVMCMFNVPGHVHMGAVSSTDAPPPPSPPPPSPPSPPLSTPPISVSASAPTREEPDAECILCKYKVAGHMHTAPEPVERPANEVNGDAEKQEESRHVESLTEDQALAVGRRRATSTTTRPVLLSSWF